MRIVEFADGATSETTPVIGNLVASNLVKYANDAAYEAAESGAPATGNIYYNTTDNTIRYYNGGWIELIDENSIQAMENKAIDADNNQITNIDNNEIKPLAGIDATKIANGSVTDTEFQYIGGLTSDAQTQLDAKIPSSEKGAVNGVAELDGSGTVPASQLPSYVDDVLEFANLAAFPVTGETGKIYIAIDTGYNYRWSGSVYIDITSKVDSVNGQTGAVSLGLTDLDDTNITPGAGEDGKVVSYDHGSGDFVLVTQSGGTGEGGINYIDNSGFEDGTSLGWTLYNDGSSSTPVDGTGGSLLALTSSVQISTALRGQRLFRLSKSGVNGQGDGASYDFAIDDADQNKVLEVFFEYETTSFLNDDVRVFVYDIDGASLIGAVENQDDGNIQTSATPNQFYAKFTATSSTNYRLIFHVASTTVGAWTLDIDRVRVRPIEESLVITMTDWEPYSPTVGGIGTTTVTSSGRWRRLGDSIELRTDFIVTSVGTGGGPVTFSLPSGLVSDASKIPNATATAGPVGVADVYNVTGATGYDVFGSTINTSSNVVQILKKGTGAFLQGSDLTLNDEVSVIITIPIVGWTSTNTYGAVLQAASGDDAFLQDSVGTLTAHPGPQGLWVAVAQVTLTEGTWNLDAQKELQMAAATSVTEVGISITNSAGTGNPGSHAVDKLFSEITNNSGDWSSHYFMRRGVVVPAGTTQTWYLRSYVGSSVSNINYACVLYAHRVKK